MNNMDFRMHGATIKIIFIQSNTTQVYFDTSCAFTCVLHVSACTSAILRPHHGWLAKQRHRISLSTSSRFNWASHRNDDLLNQTCCGWSPQYISVHLFAMKDLNRLWWTTSRCARKFKTVKITNVKHNSFIKSEGYMFRPQLNGHHQAL
jgi:hypothetical protein